MDYQGFRFQSHLNKKGYLETLLDISSPELNEPNFQPGARSMYIETSLLDISSPELNEPVLQLGAGSINMENPEKNRTQDESDFRISNILNEQDETRGDGLDISKPLEMDKRGWGMLLAKFYAMMKSCRLFMVKKLG